MEKFKKFFLKFWPLGFILTIWIIFSSPYFFQNKVPYPSKYQVTFFAPWSYYQEFAGPVKNNAMPDVINQIYPWKYFTIQTLKKGQIPFWNPYNFAGNPHIANFQSAVFSPFNLLFFVLPFIDAWSMLVLLQVLLAGIFTYLFMRELAVSKTGSLISSISFMFCGFMTTWLAYGTLSMAIAFLPLVLFSIERSFNTKTVWILPLISIALAISFFSGHVQTSLYLTIFSVFYALFKLLTTKRWQKFIIVVLFFALGLGISSLQIIPTFNLYQQSVRSSSISQEGQIPPHYLITVFAPDFYGNPVTRNDWFGYYAEWASFIGIIPFILAFFAFIKHRKTNSYFFAAFGILALLFSSDTPLRQLLAVSNIPIFATSIPSRMIVLFSFSFAVLCGFGFDNALKLIKENSKKQIFVLLGSCGLLLLTTWVLLLAFNTLPPDKIALATRNLILPTGIFLITALSLVAASFYKHKFIIIVISIILLLLTSFDSLRFAGKWMPFDERKLVYPDIKIINGIKKRIGNNRIFGGLSTEVTSYYGIQSLKGYDPLYIGRYGEFIHSSFSGNYESAERSVVQFANRSKYTEKVLDLLGVGIIFHPKADTFADWAFPVWANNEKYTLVYEDDKFQLFKNNTALPRAKLFYKYEVIKDNKALLKRFYSQDFDFRNTLLLEEELQISNSKWPASPRGEQVANGRAEIFSYTPNEITILVTTDSPALLFLSDNYYPNWKAKVNDKKAKIYRADYSFRAVAVPEGDSKVEFYYSGLF